MKRRWWERNYRLNRKRNVETAALCVMINGRDDKKPHREDMIVRNAISCDASLFFQKVCVEHLDQLRAAGSDIWTRPGQRKKPIYVIYLSGLIFSQNHAFSGCYALLVTSNAALVTMKNNSAGMRGRFSWL